MKKALLLDDDPTCRELFSEILDSFGIKVTAFSDPTCFLKNVATCPRDQACFDLIITDNDMPNMTGLGFLQKLHKMQCKIPATHKALISGKLSTEDCAAIDKLGSRAFCKPCSLDTIQQWLTEIGLLDPLSC